MTAYFTRLGSYIFGGHRIVDAVFKSLLFLNRPWMRKVWWPEEKIELEFSAV